MKIIQTFWTAGQDPLKHNFGWTHPEYNLMSWALSKIKTYSLQPDPFLHIDGDIYVLNRIPEVIAESQLVAQNREIGTGYYRQMMDKIIHVVLLLSGKNHEAFQKQHFPGQPICLVYI